jgi:hypothetical protein
MLSDIGEEGVLYDMHNNEYRVLSETMYKIITGVQSGLSTHEISNILAAEYDISSSDCLLKVDQAIS